VNAALVGMMLVGVAACGGAPAPAAEPAPAPVAAAAAPAAEPAPEAAPAAVTPGEDAAHVRRVIKANLGEITACYQEVAAKKPGLEGTVTATFTIAADGSVATADAIGVDGAVDACIIYLLRRLRFPPPTQAPLVIKYPFVFKPVDGAAGSP
jgi:outer membrane biosynthesis protein TonB